MNDKQTAENLLNNLRNYIIELERLSKLPKDELLSNTDMLGSAKYHFIVAIECVIDLTHHLISDYRLRRPNDYSDSILVLEESKYIDPNLSLKLQSMVKFRNLLVHVYGKVDDEKVCQYLNDNLSDFNDFAMAIATHIT